MILANVELDGDAGLDVRLDGGVVTEIGVALRRAVGEEMLDARGGALLPGLHDHHIHLWAHAATAASTELGPPAVSDAAAFASALRSVPGDGWVRGVGYHESVAGDLDRHTLDAIVGPRPVRVQHRSGALWVLSSEALTLTGTDRSDEQGIERDERGRPTGRLWRMDGWLRERVPKVRTDLRAISATAAAAGVTGFTDATPDRDAADAAALRDAQARGDLVQRVRLMGPVALDVEGPVKVLLDDDRLPEPDAFIDLVVHAHGRGRAVAVHCVTAVQLVLTLHALSEAGAIDGDRIEHASVVPPALIKEIARLGVTVVTQPGFVVARGDRYLTDVDAQDVDSLYRCASLLDAGVPVAAGTDAPFGPADPWTCIRAAMDRRTAGGAVLGGGERVAAGVALGLFLGAADAPGTPRSITVGAPADVCLLDAPVAVALEEPSASRVAATLVDGRVVHRASV